MILTEALVYPNKGHYDAGDVHADKLDPVIMLLYKISAAAAKENSNPLAKPEYDVIIDAFREIILLLDRRLTGKSDEIIFRIV